MNIDRILRFLTEDEKALLHVCYTQSEFSVNILNAGIVNAAKGLVNLGLVEEIEDQNHIYRFTYRLTLDGNRFVNDVLN